MKVGIVGSSGYIAGYILKRLKKESFIHQIVTIDQSDQADLYLNLIDSDLFNYDNLNDIDYIIFTAAVSGPDKCANEFDLCWKINVAGTKTFIHNAINRKCKVLFFSSDAVFGDIPGHIYTENSKTEPITPYGRMKKVIEDEFKDSNYFKVIRLSYVVSLNDRFVSYCLECIKKKNVAEVFHPFYRNCITVSDVVEVVVWFINNWDKYSPFVLNVAGKELVSRVRIADEINRCLNGCLRYTILRPKGDFYKNRPQITQMESLYIQTYNILEENNFTEKIKREMENLEL